MDVSHVAYRLASQYILDELKKAGVAKPSVGIICGSGLAGLSDALDSQSRFTIKYSSIPGFPKECTVQGHKGEVVFGLLSGVPTACFRGRFHSYEGHDMKTVVLPVNVMRCIGVQVCIVTNAAGGLNPTYNVGDVVAVSDHLAIPQLAGKNPLIGPNDDELGPRFPPTSNAYDETLRAIAVKSANELNYSFVHSHGTYCFVSGPMYESKAECRFLHTLGGDTVGMSTIPEVVTAHHCDLKVLCLSLVTNKVIMTGDEGSPVASHAEVLEAVDKRSIELQSLVKQIVLNVSKDLLPKLPQLKPVSLVISKSLIDSFRQEHGKKHEAMWDATNVWGLGLAALVVATALIITSSKTR